MASTQQRKKRGNFQLDLDDMERRLVDFRLTLQREKRRCLEAGMLAEYEKLLSDKLNEDMQANQAGQLQENAIQLKCLDDDSFKRLSTFLNYAINMCQREDQEDKLQRVIRDTLKESRRQAVLRQQASGNQKPLEPFCFFCASDTLPGPSTDSGPQHYYHRSQPHDSNVGASDHSAPNLDARNPRTQFQFPSIEFIRTGDGPAGCTANFGGHNQGAVYTPPPSAAPTPDVGDTVREPGQSRSQQGGTTTPLGSQPVVGSTSAGGQPFTNASLQGNNATASNAQPIGRLAEPPLVAPSSDQGEDTVDNSDEEDYEPNDEIRSILDNLRESGRLSQLRRQSQQQQKKKLIQIVADETMPMDQVEEDQRRSSTPLDDSLTGPMVIDEGGPPASPISKAGRSSIQRQAQQLRQAGRVQRISPSSSSSSSFNSQAQTRGSRIEQVSAKLMMGATKSTSGRSMTQERPLTQTKGTILIKKRTKKRTTRESSKQLRQNQSQQC